MIFLFTEEFSWYKLNRRLSMNSKDLQKGFTSFIKEYWLPLGLGILGLLCIGAGFMQASNKPEQEDIVFEQEDKKVEAKPDAAKQIVIDIEGAVKKPGVYHLPENSRVDDALKAAGGFHTEADHEKVTKLLNLAAKVADGGKIYIPFKGETVSSGDSQPVLGMEGNNLININSASQKELEDLPGIGAVTAGKIIDNRPYGSVDELLSKKVVGKSVFEKIREKVSAY